jgi:hypothetical protein
MKTLTDRERKRFDSLLINSKLVYWWCVKDYNQRINEIIDSEYSLNDLKRDQEYTRQLKQFMNDHDITNADIIEYLKTFENPRSKWNDKLRKHNNGGKETRDNKGQFVKSEYYPVKNIRYPKKNRNKRTWKKFYEMFPGQAIKDNWDGETSNRMK